MAMPSPTCPVCAGVGLDLMSLARDTWQCPDCLLSGPRDVLERLAARLAGEHRRGRSDANAVFREKLACADAEIERLKSPAVALAEAERLLRDAGAMHVYFSSSGRVTLMMRGLMPDGRGKTLGEAYAALAKETP